MKKKAVSIMVAVVLSTTFTVTAFAASPTTSSVMNTPVTASDSDNKAKGYTLTTEEKAATSVTAEQALAMSAGVTADVSADLSGGVTFGSVPAQPSSIAAANADLLKNEAVNKELKKLGIGATAGQPALIIKAGQLLFSNFASGTFTVGLDVDGITSAKGVALLVYVPGELQPRVIKPKWKNGRLESSLPVPCEYNVVMNEKV